MKRHILTVMSATFIALLTTLAVGADHRESPGFAFSGRQIAEMDDGTIVQFVLFQAEIHFLPTGAARGFVFVEFCDGTIQLFIASETIVGCDETELLVLVTPVIIHPDGEIEVLDEIMLGVTENRDNPECLIWDIKDSCVEAEGRILCGWRGR